MLTKNKMININGNVKIEEDGKEITVMTMCGIINEDGSVTFNKYIQDREVYLKHKEKADKDYIEFEEYVERMMGV